MQDFESAFGRPVILEEEEICATIVRNVYICTCSGTRKISLWRYADPTVTEYGARRTFGWILSGRLATLLAAQDLRVHPRI